MDYDATEIAKVYDRARALVPETARLWRDLLVEYVDAAAGATIIDLGCGTGRFSQLLAHAFDVPVVGIDPSAKMLAEARAKPACANLSYRQGAAEALPLPDRSAGLVFISNVYHHLSDAAAAGRECRRVLRPSGHVCMRNGTRENDFPQRHFFALERLIDSELPRRADVIATFEASGLGLVAHRVIVQATAPDWPSFVEKSALRGDSFLARLSDAEFDAGMAAMQTDAATRIGDGAVTEEIDWFVFESGLQ